MADPCPIGADEARHAVQPRPAKDPEAPIDNERTEAGEEWDAILRCCSLDDGHVVHLIADRGCIKLQRDLLARGGGAPESSRLSIKKGRRKN